MRTILDPNILHGMNTNEKLNTETLKIGILTFDNKWII